MKQKIMAITLCSVMLGSSLIMTSCADRETTPSEFRIRMGKDYYESVVTYIATENGDTDESDESSEDMTEDTSDETTEDTSEEAEDTETKPSSTTASAPDKEFTDVDIDLDEVKVLEAYSQIYDYNEDFEDVYVCYDNDGSISMLFGTLTDFTVDSPDEALIAIYSLQNIIGCKDPFNELVFSDVQSDGTELYYRFYQFYDSVSVTPGEVKIITDLDGNTTGLVNAYVPINISTEPSIDADDAIKEIADVKKVISSELIIWTMDTEPVLVWRIIFDSTKGLDYTALVDADNGTVLSVYDNKVY